MNRFIMLNNKYTSNSRGVFVNVDNINYITEEHTGGTIIYFSNDNNITVNQAMDTVKKLMGD